MSKNAVFSHRKSRLSIIAFLTLLFAVVSVSFGTIIYSADSNSAFSNDKDKGHFLPVLKSNKLELILGRGAFLKNSFLTPDTIFIVNSNGDSNDIAPGNGVCLDSNGNCTLRAAIQEANVTDAADQINFALSTPTTIHLNPSLTPEELIITKALTITGPGARLLTVNGIISSGARTAESPDVSPAVFNVNTATSVTTNISGLTIANSGGRGINNSGKLNLSDVHIRNHQYGVYNSGILNLTRALIRSNTRGGVYLNLFSTSNISNTTITGNSSVNHGGGIHSLSSDLTLNNVTISNNSAATGGGGLYFNSSSSGIYVRNTIIAGNNAPGDPDILSAGSSTGANFVSRGNNLIGKSSGNMGFVDGTNGDKVGTTAVPVDPMLGLLQNNGGQVDTIALQMGSPAKDAGNNCVTNSNCGGNNPPASFLLTDQRGGADFPRNFENGVDIGAFEAYFPTPTLDSLSPDKWGTGRGSFELTVNGSHFVMNSKVNWNGQERATTFISNSQLKAQILASDVTTAGIFPVNVVNPQPNGGTSETINFTVADCTFSISPNSQNFGVAGGTGGINVTTTNGCVWTAESSASWITINSGSSGTGNGTVSFTVAPNGGPARNGTITINGQIFNITQAIGCTVTINPTNQNLGAAGGPGSFTVTADSSCQWAAATTDSWITITGEASGTGNGTINFTIAANTGPARTGTITAGDKTFTVNQESGCAFTINPTSQNIGAAGGPGSFAVTASSGCQWNAAASDSWITITGSSSGNGNGTVNFTVAANTGPQRTGTITVGGQTFTITQSTGCAFTLNPTTANIAGAGGAEFFDVSTTAGCEWTAASNVSWITVTSGSPGTGNGRVNFTVAANTGPARTGTITAGDKTFTVNQQSGCAVTINPTSQNIGAAGGPGSFAVTSENGCQWNALTTSPWITITGSASGTGNGTINFTVAANTGPQRTGTITVGGQTFTVNQDSGCTFALSPTSASIPSGGGTGSFNVTAVTGCTWTAVTSDSWITVTGGGTGNGNGTVNFSVAANPGVERTGKITVNGQDFTITQASGCAISLSPTSATVIAAGGTSSFNVTIPSGCSWTAVSNASWITVTGGTPGNGNGTVNFTVAANTGPARSGTITVGNQTFTVNQDNGCTFTLNPASAAIVAAGGSGFFDVTAGTGCAWTATTTATWITITGGSPGSGNGRVNFTVAANNGPARSGTITIGNQTFTVNQENGCTFTLNPTSYNAAPAGGTSSFTIVASNSGCQWTATTTDSWITITGNASGTGDGTINFTVAPNTGPQRTGTITVGGRTFTITQGNGCTYSLSPTGTSFQPGGGSGSFNVTVNNQACTWTATTTTPWITITAPSSGTGNGTVNFTVAPNVSPLRTGTINVNGQVFTITQENGCTYSLSASSANISAAGGTGSFNVNSGAGCTWTVQSNASWITITSSTNGSGSSTVTFTVAANNGPERSGTITAAGQTFTVNQANGCTFSLAPTSGSFTPAGGSGSFTVTASHGGCSWSASAGDTWITITAGASGTGNGTVQFTVAANISPQRTGTITVGNSNDTQTFTITQANGCTYSISPTSTGVDELGGIRSFNVSSGPGCPWTAVSNDSWITVTGGATGSGNGTVTLSIAATSGAERSGTVTAAGRTFTVNQISLRVTNLNDSGIGSLRRAVANANSTPNSDVITFLPTLAGTIVLTSGEIRIENNGALEIRGPGANSLRISGNNTSRIFYNDNGTLTISGLQLTKGNGVGEDSFELERYGGAIYSNHDRSQGSLTLDRVEIISNAVAVPNEGGSRAIGGGVYYFGGMNHRIENSTFSFNESDFGAGFYNFGPISISNSTFYGNKAKRQGGAMYAVADVKLRSTTITQNSTTATGHTGAGIMIEGGVINIGNTIVSENSGPDITYVAGGFLSMGNNLIGDAPGDSTNTNLSVPYHSSDIRDVPPLIATLFLYGGSTNTAALMPGSPAINAASHIDVPATDQRGSTRVIDGIPDIGAFEHNITISPLGPGLPNADLGVFYNQALSTFRSDNTDPSGYFEYFIVDGFLTSSGIELIQESGVIRGTPTRSGEYVFTVRSVGADGMAGANRYSITVGCAISINPANQSFNPAGGTGTINVTAGAGCAWTAASNSPWITVTGGGNGSGNGTVNFSVAANGTGSARSGKITIGEKEFTVNQTSDCAFTINPTSQNVAATGGTGSFAVTASGGNCAWNASAGALWITITGGASGTGNGTVNYSVASNNTGAARTGTIIAGGQTFTINQAAAASVRRVAYEFDGDGKADVAVYRPSAGSWYILGSRDGFNAVQFGIATDKPVPADYDGDGKTDVAVYRDGNWYLLKSRDGFEAISFGVATDKPVPGDYDGDGRADAAVYRDGNWYILGSRDGFSAVQFGIATDKPVPADYDGDGRADAAVYRDGNWYILGSRDGFSAVSFGITTDKPLPGDYDGDGKADQAVYRDGNWYLWRSRDGFTAIAFGVVTDIPVPADYDGDGKTDVAVYRDGTWHMLDSGQNESQAYRAVQFGSGSDIPIPASLQ